MENNLEKNIPNIDSNSITLTLRGRISGKTYWKYYALILPIIMMMYLSAAFSVTLDEDIITQELLLSGIIDLIIGLLVLILLMIISICADVRRFHDFNLSGYYLIPLYIIMLIISAIFVNSIFILALVTILYVLIMSVIPSSKGENRYSSKPNIQ